MSGPIDAYDEAPPSGRAIGAMPESSMGDVFAASRTLAETDRFDGEQLRLQRDYAPLLEVLNAGRPRSEQLANPGLWQRNERRGGARAGSLLEFGDYFRADTWASLLDEKVSRDQQKARVFERLRAFKAANPGRLADIPDTLDAFEARAIERERAKRDAARGVVARGTGWGGTLAGLAGGATELLTDPVNIATLPFGGAGRTAAQVFLREALVNAAITTVQLPQIADNRAAIGEELGVGEAVTMVGSSAALTGALSAGLFAGGRAIGRAIDEATPIDRKLARALAEAELPDADLPALVRGLIGWETMTPDERAAVTVLEREAEVDGATPFAAGGPTLETHGEKLAAAIAAIEDGAEAPAPRLSPAATGSGQAPLGTVVSRGTSGRERLKAAIRGVESGGDDAAKNPRSSASGRYQFTQETWEALGGDWSKRFDGQEQERLMDRLTAANAQALARGGEAETAGNLYLAHFAGSGGALKVLKAAPDTPVEAVLGRAAVTANPFLKGKSAGDLVDWAHAKMGEPGFAGGRVVLAREGFERGDFGEAAWREAQAALDAETMARLAARKAQAGADGDAVPAIDFGAVLTRWEDEVAQPPPPAAPAATTSPEALAALPAVRAAIGDRSVSLDPVRLAQRLGIDEGVAREALNVAAARRMIRQVGGGWTKVTKNGAPVWDKVAIALPKKGGPKFKNVIRKVWREPRFVRNPARDPNAPRELLRRVAEAGGVREGLSRNDLVGRDFGNVFIPGVGKLLRKDGMTIDEVGEMLHEDLWFPGRDFGEISEADVLDLLDRAVQGERIVHPDDAGLELGRLEAVGNDEFVERVRGLAGDLDLDDALLDAVGTSLPRFIDEALDMDDAIELAIAAAIGDRANAAARMALFDNPENAYAHWAELEAEGYAGSPDPVFDESGGGPGLLDGDAGRGGAFGEEPDGAGASWPGRERDERDAQGLGPLPDEAAFARYDDPAADGATAQTDSLDHDLRMQLDRGAAIDPAIADRQRQETQLGAAAPLRKPVEQDGTMGLGLFDAADQPGFKLDDSDERPLADLLRELDEDEAALKAIEACAKPPKAAG